MDIFIIICSGLLMLIGLIGCFIPILPGPPINYAGLLLLQLLDPAPFSIKFMGIWAVVTIVVFLLDYLVPLYGAKRYGGSKWGILGCSLGLIAGLIFFPPFGIIIGPVLGAFIAETLHGRESKDALKAAFGSFVGFLVGTLTKVTASSFMIYYFFKAVV